MKFVWANPEQKLDDFYLNVNWKSKEIGLGHHKAESDWFSLKKL